MRIIKHGVNIFESDPFYKVNYVCRYCGCNFEFEKKDMVRVSDRICIITCPECENTHPLDIERCKNE